MILTLRNLCDTLVLEYPKYRLVFMTNAELAILSLVAEKPRHGYDIEHIIEQRGMREWTDIGFSSIYYVLNKLEKEGMIESQLHQPDGRGPARKVYSITPGGEAAHIEGVLEILSAPRSGISPFLLGLSNLPFIPLQQLLSALNSYAVQLEGRLKHLREKAEEQRPLTPYVEAMFDYSQTLIAAELNWIRKFIHQVEIERVKS